MSDLIEKLTPEQEEQLQLDVQKWLDIGRCTDRADREVTENALVKMYEKMGRDKPHIWWCEGPSEMMETREILAAFEKKSAKKMHKMSPEQLKEYVDGERSKRKISITDWRVMWGCYELYWVAFYRWPDENLRPMYSDEHRELLHLWSDIVCNIAWWAPHEHVVFVSERPEMYSFDERWLLHNEEGPAIRCRDGWEVYCWHGVNVPGEWIKGDIDAQTALQWENVEQRRAACEIVGWDNILNNLNAKAIDTHANPMVGTLLEVDLPDSGKERFLRVLCGTGRTFAMPVPPEMTTAEDAQRWMNNIPDEVTFLPEVRT